VRRQRRHGAGRFRADFSLGLGSSFRARRTAPFDSLRKIQKREGKSTASGGTRRTFLPSAIARSGERPLRLAGTSQGKRGYASGGDQTSKLARQRAGLHLYGVESQLHNSANQTNGDVL